MYLKIVKQNEDMQDLCTYLYTDGKSICDVESFNLPEHYQEEYFGSWFDVIIYILVVY